MKLKISCLKTVISSDIKKIDLPNNQKSFLTNKKKLKTYQDVLSIMILICYQITLLSFMILLFLYHFIFFNYFNN